MAGTRPTAERLIETASRHLARLGPRAVELRAICEELDISPSLVNYYFKSPAELIWRAALLGYETHVAEQARAFAGAPTGQAALEAWIQGTIDWAKENPGIAAVVNFPMLAFGADEAGESEALVEEIGRVSRLNVTTLGSAVWSAMTGRPPKQLSSARVAMLISTNSEFAFWVGTIGFGGQGAAMWIAGRKPYSFVWRALGFDPESQIKTTLKELVARVVATDGNATPVI